MADWIIPCNPKYYDIDRAFDSLDTIDWRQTTKSIEPGDRVYIYVGIPVQAVAYRCKVLDTLIPPELSDDSDAPFGLEDDPDHDPDKYPSMRLKTEKKIPPYLITLEKMRDAGLKGNIQSARRVPEELRELFAKADEGEQVYPWLDEQEYYLMPPERNSRPCQIPIQAGRFRYLTKEFAPGTGEDGWVMFHHPGHFMIYDRETRKCIADASYGMFRSLDLEYLDDDEIVAVIFEMRLPHDRNGHEERRGWDVILQLMKEV